tara:strand:- start:21 stop:407 length:387 start_codon:yes stop_codon:yes gene_type:complete
MTSIQIPNINYSNGKIQECQLIIDSKAFNISYQNNQYVVSQGQGTGQQKNNASPGNNTKSSTQNTAQSSSSSGDQTNVSSPVQSQTTSGQNTSGVENALSGQLAKPSGNKRQRTEDIQSTLAGQLKRN